MPKDGAGQCERGGASHKIQRLIDLIVWIHINSENGAEYLLRHNSVPRVF